MFGWIPGIQSSSVSCASRWYCLAVGQFGLTQLWNGTSWAEVHRASIAPTKMSCPTSSLCVVVGNAGEVQMWDQGNWSRVLTVDAGHNLTAVACGAVSYCVALDNSGRELTYNGQWSSPQTLDAVSLSFVDVPDSISCPTEAFCEAVTGLGTASALLPHLLRRRFLLQGRVGR